MGLRVIEGQQGIITTDSEQAEVEVYSVTDELIRLVDRRRDEWYICEHSKLYRLGGSAIDGDLLGSVSGWFPFGG